MAYQNKMDLSKMNGRCEDLISLTEVSQEDSEPQVRMKNNNRKGEELNRYRERRRAKKPKILDIKFQTTKVMQICLLLSHNLLAILTFIALLNQNIVDLYELPQINSSRENSNSSGIAQPPSQLFLTPISHQRSQSIRLVNGVKKSDIEEDDGGFIMKTIQPALQSESTSDNKDLNTDSVMISTTKEAPNDEATATTEINSATTTSPQTDLTTLIDLSGSIPIDANRQQFLTHDQLSLMNATTKDENIYLNNEEKENSEPSMKRAQSPRSGLSKVSHVSSFLSGELLSTNKRLKFRE